ncbi:hypothetical protein [Bacillus cereus]|uniref:hypothetical protein n=1 Tax=Bacillus cereus TaxID=1396 RepID=UPI003D02C39C
MWVDPMSLAGGIDEYSFGDRYDGPLPAGRKVYFLNKNGYDSEREHAATFFEEGQVLTVKEIYVGRSNSKVEFVEHPLKKFNTVMFADCIEEGAACHNESVSSVLPDGW